MNTPPFSKVFLFILDGFGLDSRGPGNAILQAKTPYLDELVRTYPAMSIAAAGLVVGLPWGQPGNSEVGHSAIGTGRIIIQDLAYINNEIRSGAFFRNPALVGACAHARERGSALHIIGCTSPGGIHSHEDHLFSLLELAAQQKVAKVFVHVITDGQDMPGDDGIHTLQKLQPFLKKSGARIASIQGRSYAMDRVLNWKLTERVWHSIVLGDAPHIPDATGYLREQYGRGENDYSLEPRTVVDSGGMPIGAVNNGDACIFFDFRNDRARQLVSPFVEREKFAEFERGKKLDDLFVATMTRYSDAFHDVHVAYEPPRLDRTLGEIISSRGERQYRIAEKEKEAHVTNFFNGGRIHPFDGEERVIVSSRPMRGHEYIEHPEMSAEKIVDAVRTASKTDARLFVINFANPDMIGHAGDLQATIKAVQVTDSCLGEIVPELLAHPDWAVIITADHGNAEELLDPLTGKEDTQHSTRNVPVIFAAQTLRGVDNKKTIEGMANENPIGTLVDVAPTILSLLGVEKPSEMAGSRLVDL